MSIFPDREVSEVLIQTAIGDVASVITTHSVEIMKRKVGDKAFAVTEKRLNTTVKPIRK